MFFCRLSLHLLLVWDEPSRPEWGVDHDGVEEHEDIEEVEDGFVLGDRTAVALAEFRDTVY